MIPYEVLEKLASDWRIVSALLMHKAGLTEMELTPALFESFNAEGKGVVLIHYHEHDGRAVVRRMTQAEADALRAEDDKRHGAPQETSGE